MRFHSGKLVYAPTDLSNFLSCRHLTHLDETVARGESTRPVRVNSLTRELQQRGIAHEKAYLEHLSKQGLGVASASRESDRFEHTRSLMDEGVDVIYQASLTDDHWSGVADFLVKIDTPSDLGEWSYEVTDTKFARDTRAGTILQLCVYSYVVEKLQGVLPEQMYVVTPATNFVPNTYRTRDYGAYFRLLRGDLRNADEAIETYPELVSHCDVCAWWSQCEERRRGDDNLCYVAGISQAQISSLKELEIDSLEKLASLEEVPKPARGSGEALIRSRDQARVQSIGREKGEPYYEFREPFGTDHGLALLPEPTPDDIFLDFEGSHFIEGGVQEYLTGWTILQADGSDHYSALVARTEAEEKQAFERFMDVAIEMHDSNPRAHIYHYAPYEPAALKRLMGAYATRETELDTLLRGGVFVDLYSIVKRSLIAGVERYSIKDLEVFFGYERAQDLRQASASRRIVEAAIEAGALDKGLDEHFEIVKAYNREDCISARRLRDWLEQLRSQLVQGGQDLPRPAPLDDTPSPEVGELDQRLLSLRDDLLADIPTDRADRTPEQQAQFILAHLMGFHRRENKATWWEYFRLLDLDTDEFGDERRAITGLEFSEVIRDSKAPVQRFRFPAQELDARKGDEIYNREQKKVGSVASIDLIHATIDIKKTMKSADEHPSDVVLHKSISAAPLQEALIRLGEAVVRDGISPSGQYRTSLELLLRRQPTAAASEESLQGRDESTLEAAYRIARELDGGVLAIQGPPGSGKTYTGGEIICELVGQGKRVGVTAVSHKVIVNLLEGAVDAARIRGIEIRCVHKNEGEYKGSHGIRFASDYPSIKSELADGSIDVLGGTAWQWSRPDFEDSVDVMIVDEAGQMALGNVLAVALAGNGLVLLGDPQQLEQPLQASHPEGTEISSLHHILDGAETMPQGRGLFLEKTYRMHPDVAAFTSEIYYQNRLATVEGLQSQTVSGSEHFSGSGLRFVPVVHRGNRARSHEEVDAIEKIVGELSSTMWRDKTGADHQIQSSDILIVAPYNAQVSAISARLPDLRVGTVDRFQGQEAPVVVYSMTSSTPEEAPRGMEFLYNPNRFNVATSRAKALCIVVGSPALFEPECKSPWQMKMANAFCRYRELAETVAL